MAAPMKAQSSRGEAERVADRAAAHREEPGGGAGDDGGLAEQVQQFLRFQVEAQQEQQEHDADVRHVLDHLRVRHQPRAERPDNQAE